MKKIIVIAILAFSNWAIAQEKLVCKSGIITFEASVPSFEEVKATNKSVTVVLNPATGEIASLALVKGFRFKVALMEEHFNENYIESDQYPKATFKGKLENFDSNSLTATPKDFTVNGKLELHGKTVAIKTVIKMSKSSGGINMLSNFSVNASDFNIAIPSVVKNKVSNKINVQLNAVLK
ncbi:YceI family protein [Flavobacterium sp. Fl-77]|uniref:YceI family protein n=1 Tax=Flavobacterium flavipigmentatum TaxID=2893884 RepID=A0AAJ2VWT6_9FLAO|nr:MULTISPECIES: YceI family protein [unclassified Flavobacterium]MDX6180898.1 YceI family protein [Flavobacterium sp. Fl-33]MDX6184499.1 YceI family protein [Flavobacterium sp. Fl-77]UFH39606.1 YceI family protein [Flavobacterium sp. F-70]